MCAMAKALGIAIRLYTPTTTCWQAEVGVVNAMQAMAPAHAGRGRVLTVAEEDIVLACAGGHPERAAPLAAIEPPQVFTMRTARPIRRERVKGGPR
jgi:hypothetical protein